MKGANNRVSSPFRYTNLIKLISPDRLIDFGNDDQILTPNERAAKMKKKEEVRKMLSKQRFFFPPLRWSVRQRSFFRLNSMQDVNEHEYSDGSQFHSSYQFRRVDKERERVNRISLRNDRK